MWGWLTSPFHFSWLPESTLTVNHTLRCWPHTHTHSHTHKHTSTHHQRPRAKPWETRSRLHQLSVTLRPVSTQACSNNFPSQGNSSTPSSLRRDLSKPRPPVCAIYLKCDNVSVEGNSSLAPAGFFSNKHTRGLVTWQSFPWPSDMFGGRASEADQHLAGGCVCFNPGKQHEFKKILISGGLH